MIASPAPAPSDGELVERLRRGDPGAFDAVYARYESRLFTFLLRLSGRRDVAEDLAQETWLKFAKASPRLREDTSLAALLFASARNAFVSHRRWALVDLTRIVTFGVEALSAASSEPSPEAHHERAHALATLERALLTLPVASREVLLLVGVEGMDQEDVARILGITYEALRQRLSRARKELSTRMRDLETKRPTGAAKRGEMS